VIREIDIMNAVAKDLDEILQIENRSFSSPWSKRLFLADLNDEYTHIYIAKDCKNGKICGYICFSLIVDELHILNLAVDEPYRRKGIAARLLLHCLDTAGKGGAKIAYLEVRESHKVAIGFYEKNGFKIIARRKKYYSDNGEDALIMINYI
jgi:ribosomal-protein-alanine N-acetyltransferase